MKSRTYWMHTIGGRPAAFDGHQISYGWRRALLVGSLKQIREERQKSIEYRYRNKFSIGLKEYGYITVRLPRER